MSLRPDDAAPSSRAANSTVASSTIARPIATSPIARVPLARRGTRLSRSPVRTIDAVAPDAPLELATRLISEAAHDLRSPLSGVRESLCLVRDGDLGAVNATQREMLGDAIDQCDAIQVLVDNMLHLDRLRSGVPAIRRQWIASQSIPASAEAMLGAIASVRRVRVCWEGFEGGQGPLYGDPQLLSRLLVNLIGNAVAVSPEGAMVMITLRPSVSRGMLRLTVADQGPGMSAAAIGRWAIRGESGTGGSGLGLAIGRALAALHYGQLRVASRPGTGTRISIELPATGPTSVADAFAHWRETLTPSRATPAAPASALTASGIRIDSPEHLKRTRFQDEVTLPFDGRPPRSPDSISVLGLRVGKGTQPTRAQMVDDLLQSDQQLHELVYRTDMRRWVVMWDNKADEVRRRCAVLERGLSELGEIDDWSWSAPLTQGVGHRGNRGTLREMLIRDVLHASSRTPLEEDRNGRWTEEDILRNDEISARRLDEEIRRLGVLVRQQSGRLQEQADRISRVTREE